MFGGGSIQLARVFGVRIGVDPSWFFVLFLIIYLLTGSFGDLFPDGTAFVLAVVSALLFFVSVLLHELGHAVVAMRSGIRISGIDLWMFGGVAKMERDTRTAGEEFRVAVAGPVVTLVIAAACFGICLVIAGGTGAVNALQFDPRSNEVLAVAGYLAFVNAALLVFNLIPGFPLDGGRIARSVVWWRTGDRTRATRVAARLGRVFSIILIGLGIFSALQGVLVTGIWFVLIGVFLGQAARAEELRSVLTGRIEALRVQDVMDAEPVAVPGELTLDRARDDYFLRYGYAWFPVVDAAGRLIGLVTRESVEGLPEALHAGRTVASVMAADGADGSSGLRVDADEPLEALLGRQGLQRLGAVMAVDGEGRLRGIVTIDQVRRALEGDGAPTAPTAPA